MLGKMFIVKVRFILYLVVLGQKRLSGFMCCDTRFGNSKFWGKWSIARERDCEWVSPLIFEKTIKAILLSNFKVCWEFHRLLNEFLFIKFKGEINASKSFQ